MAKYRKKPVVIEAIQFRAGERSAEMERHINSDTVGHTKDGTMIIRTLEGVMEARPGDWIIRGVAGELYPCKPDIFTATYERVEDQCDDQ